MNIAELMKERQRSFYNSGATKDVDFRLAQLKKLKQMVESKRKRNYECSIYGWANLLLNPMKRKSEFSIKRLTIL